MRELIVKVSESQFDLLVSFLKTLPYVQLPTLTKRIDINDSNIGNAMSVPPSDNYNYDISELGEMDNTPFDIKDVEKNNTIKWENFQDVIELFKDIPLENHIESHTELHPH